MKALIAWFNATRIARTLKESSQKGTPVMAAGMAYMGLFSVFAGLWAVFSVLGLIIGGREDIQMWIIDSIRTALPGVIGEDNAIDPTVLLDATVFGWTGAIALIGTVWTALSWLNGARIAIRTIFELPPVGHIPFVVAKLRDFALVIVALIIMLMSAASIAAGSGAISWLLGSVGIGGDWVVREFLIEGASFVVAALFDALLLAGIVRVLASIRVPKRILIPAALLGGIALTAIKALATMLVGGASANPLLATFAALLSVLILFNLMATVQLMIASWVKVSMDDLGASPRRLTAEEAAEEAQATAVRAHQELLAAEELQLREQLRDSSRFKGHRAKRRLREVEEERLEMEQHDLELRMWNGDRPDSIRT